MTADEKYMKEALRQAKKAEALLEVPIGSFRTIKSLPEAIIEEIQTKTPYPMRS